MKIPVFLASDDNYAPFLATTILSMAKNTSSKLAIFVLDGGVSPARKGLIEQMCDKELPHVSLEWIDVDVGRIFGKLPTMYHFTRSVYSRMLIPELKKDLDKVIYSDVDVIFCGDVADLFLEDLSGYAIGACWEDYMEEKGENAKRLLRLRIRERHKYFATGLLLIDSKMWRENQITSRLLELGESMKDYLQFPDQDILNKYFVCNYKMLDEKYCIAAPRVRKHCAHGRLQDCVIRHFEGGKKPWLVHPWFPEWKKSNYIGKGIFWKYAKQTPFYDELTERFPVYRFVGRMKAKIGLLGVLLSRLF